MAELTPDFEQARRFLEVLDPAANYRDLLDGYPNGFTFQTFDDRKDRKDRKLANIVHGTLDELFSRLSRFNTAGAGVFVTINETDGQGRKLENIISQRAVWIEDDEGYNVELTIEPHLVTETSPGKSHKIFLVEGLSKEAHQIIQDRLVKYYGSDKNARDLARVLRLPGMYHCKAAPRMVRLVQALDKKPYSVEEIFEAFPELGVETATPSLPARTDSADYKPLTEQEPLPDITLAVVADYLPPPHTISDYSEWRDVGMALHHQFAGSEEALAVFDDWSQEVYGYQGYEDVAKAWSGFGGRNEKVVTFKSLIHGKKVREHEEKKEAYSSIIERGMKLLTQCDDALILLDEVAPKLSFIAEGNVGFEKELTEALMLRYGELKPGKRLLRSEAVKAMKQRPKTVERQINDDLDTENPDTPEWAKNWIYVSEDDRFFNYVTRASLKTEAFRNHFTSKLRKIGIDDIDATRYVLDNGLVPKVIRSMYMPSCGTIFTHDGVRCVNTCSREYGAAVPDVVEDQQAVEIFRRHIENICGGWNREAHIFCNWLGSALGPNYKKIRWAVMLIGKFGDGKSMFSTLAATALGITNVKPVSSSLIMRSAESGQTGWAEGAMCGFIEEIKWHGHNRYDAANAMKEYITNDVVPCKKMHKESIAIPNTMNYFFTSNYIDGMPVEEGDRRVFMLHSKLDQRVKLQGKEGVDYFNELFRVIKDKKCVGSIIRWLADLEWHEEFNPDGRSPMTEIKAEVIRLVSDDVPSRIEEIMEDDASPLYQKDILLFDALLQRLSMMTSGVFIESSKKLSTVLSSMGYSALSRLRINGERHSIWIKRELMKSIPADKAKEIIEKRIRDKDNRSLSMEEELVI